MYDLFCHLSILCSILFAVKERRGWSEGTGVEGRLGAPQAVSVVQAFLSLLSCHGFSASGKQQTRSCSIPLGKIRRSHCTPAPRIEEALVVHDLVCIAVYVAFKELLRVFIGFTVYLALVARLTTCENYCLAFSFCSDNRNVVLDVVMYYLMK